MAVDAAILEQKLTTEQSDYPSVLVGEKPDSIPGDPGLGTVGLGGFKGLQSILKPFIAPASQITNETFCWNFSEVVSKRAIISDCSSTSQIQIDTQSPSVTVEASFISVAKLFHIDNIETTRRFFDIHEELPALVLEAYRAIRQYFADATLVLDSVSIPQEPDSEHLTLKIVTDLDFEDAMSRRDQLYESWWNENYPRADGKLSLRLTF